MDTNTIHTLRAERKRYADRVAAIDALLALCETDNETTRGKATNRAAKQSADDGAGPDGKPITRIERAIIDYLANSDGAVKASQIKADLADIGAVATRLAPMAKRGLIARADGAGMYISA